MELDGLLGHAWISDGEGNMVTQDQVRLKEIIEDYDPTMCLTWIPPHNRLPEDTHIWGIMHEPGNREPYIIFTMTEEDMRNPAEILARLFRGDTRKHDVFGNIEKYKAAQEILKLKEQMDKDAERMDLARHIWKSPKARYRHNGTVYE